MKNVKKWCWKPQSCNDWQGGKEPRMLHRIKVTVDGILCLQHVFSAYVQALQTLAKEHPDVISTPCLGKSSLLLLYNQLNSPSCSPCPGTHWPLSPWVTLWYIRLPDSCCFSFFISWSDTNDLRSIKECAQQVESQVGTGGLNLLINNAAILIDKTLLETSSEDMQNTFNTNVLGPMNMIKVSKSESV